MLVLRGFLKERRSNFHRTQDIRTRYIEVRDPPLFPIRAGDKNIVRFKMRVEISEQ